jgi:hypothetical protein
MRKPGRLGAYVHSVRSNRRLDQPGDAETGETRQRGGHDDAEARRREHLRYAETRKGQPRESPDTGKPRKPGRWRKTRHDQR